MRRFAALGFAVGITVLRPSFARADDHVERAEALFREAKALVDAGRPIEACPKYEQSQALDPGAGTQFFLASCYETTGKLAAAFLLFRDLEGVLARVNDPRAKTAGERARALEKRVPVVTIHIPWAKQVTGLSVTRDGSPVAADADLRLELGHHVIEVRADGRKPWSSAIDLGEGAVTNLAVPALEPLPMEQPRSPWRTAAIIVGGVGAATVITGGVILAIEKVRYSDAVKSCPDVNGRQLCNTAASYDDARSATSTANVATVIGGVGLTALAAGVVLWLAAPNPKATGLRVVPYAGFGSAGLTLGGTL